MVYDAAGNLTNDGSHPFTYDTENRLATAAGVTYTYDGDGKRVKKSNGTLYWTGPGSDPLLETDLSGNATAEYVFFNGKRVARVNMPGNSPKYYFEDHLGSTDIVTNPTGGIVEESDYVPYGGEVVITGGDPNHFKFNGKERDAESGLDQFGARYYSSGFGRFMIPDWAAKPTSVPYANFGNPQSLNLYSYVQNNPTTVGDPDGHQDEKDPKEEMREETKEFDNLREAYERVEQREIEERVIRDAKPDEAIANNNNEDPITGKCYLNTPSHEEAVADRLNEMFPKEGRYSGRYEDGEKAFRTNVPRDAKGDPEPHPDAKDAAHSRLQPDAKNPSRTYSATEFNNKGEAQKRTDFAGRKGDTVPHTHDYDPKTKSFSKVKKPVKH
jgi:RHS repeat-associated protein